MPRPATIPTFATDATLTAGPQAGSAARLQPSSGLLTQGFYQGRRVPARMLSWLFGTTGDWIGYLSSTQAHAALRFTRTDLNAGTSTPSMLSPVQQTIGIGAPANRQKSILATGTTYGGFPSFSALNDGTSPANIVNYGSGGLPTSAPVSDSSGVIFYGATGGGVKSSSNACASSSSVTVTGLTAAVSWVGFTTSHYLVFEPSTTKLFKSTALGGTWTNSTVSVDSIQSMMTNSAGVYVLACLLSGVPKMYRSTDDGVTWNFVASLSSANSCCGDYSANDGRFYVLTAAGELWSSSDGAIWSTVLQVSALAGLNFYQNAFAACGPVLACVANRPINSLSRYPYGIAYTLDRGLTWNEIYIGNPLGGNPIYSMISANGRLYATDGIALYQSGLLETPPALFTGV